MTTLYEAPRDEELKRLKKNFDFRIIDNFLDKLENKKLRKENKSLYQENKTWINIDVPQTLEGKATRLLYHSGKKVIVHPNKKTMFYTEGKLEYKLDSKIYFIKEGKQQFEFKVKDIDKLFVLDDSDY